MYNHAYIYTSIHTTHKIYVCIHILTYENEKTTSNQILIMQLRHIRFKGKTHQIC